MQIRDDDCIISFCIHFELLCYGLSVFNYRGMTYLDYKVNSHFFLSSSQDWGGAGVDEWHATNQYAVARQLTNQAIGTSFIVNVGDNHYYAGTSSVDDPLWRVNFEDVYNDTSLFIPWFSILGNHGKS